MGYINKLLDSFSLGAKTSKILAIVIMAVLLFLSMLIVYLISKEIILALLAKYIKNNRFKWDNVFLEKGVFHRLIKIIPVLMLYTSAPLFFNLESTIKKASLITIILISVSVLNSVLDAVTYIYGTFEISQTRPIKGLLQVVKIIFYILMGILSIAVLLGERVIILLSGIGAMTAIFSLVFKDSILGLVAGIQLSSNDMLRIGDWIQMERYGADGSVVDISLNTVKVQNFDKTIVAIPAYALVSDSFTNWRGMLEAGGVE